MDNAGVYGQFTTVTLTMDNEFSNVGGQFDSTQQREDDDPDEYLSLDHLVHDNDSRTWHSWESAAERERRAADRDLRTLTYADAVRAKPGDSVVRNHDPGQDQHIACQSCQERMIECMPGAERCLQCEKYMRVCRRYYLFSVVLDDVVVLTSTLHLRTVSCQHIR